jgi:hypothetical protein
VDFHNYELRTEPFFLNLNDLPPDLKDIIAGGRTGIFYKDEINFYWQELPMPNSHCRTMSFVPSKEASKSMHFMLPLYVEAAKNASNKDTDNFLCQ